jgi:hypothetical protein
MIPFSQLTEDPYNMVNGQMIVVRSQAVNVNGSGLWSEENEPIVPVVLSGIVVDVSIEDNEEILMPAKPSQSTTPLVRTELTRKTLSTFCKQMILANQ